MAYEKAGHPSFRALRKSLRWLLAQAGIRLWWAAPTTARHRLRQASYRARLPKPCVVVLRRRSAARCRPRSCSGPAAESFLSHGRLRGRGRQGGRLEGRAIAPEREEDPGEPTSESDDGYVLTAPTRHGRVPAP